MAKNKKYDETDITVLSDRDHVRLRLPVYAGSTNEQTYKIPILSKDSLDFKQLSFIPAVYKCINEIIDNSLDEFTQITTQNKVLRILSDASKGKYTIEDNGRGVPIALHSTGKHTPEVVFGSLRSGRNFTANKEAGVIGQNGIGSSMTCFCSTTFEIDIKRDKKHYTQTFTDGGLKVTKPKIKDTSSSKTGTAISFSLDPSVFNTVVVPEELIRNRAIEVSLTNPNITTEYNNEKFKFKGGFEDVIKQFSSKYHKFTIDNIEVFVIFDKHQGIDEEMYTWVNSSLLFDGGLCNTQFLNAFYEQTIETLAPQAKKNKCEVTKNDVKRDLLVLANLKITDPEYDAQSKTRLTGPNLRKDMLQMIQSDWKSFTRKHKDWLGTVIERANARFHKQADDKATKDLEKNRSKKVPGLLDATSRNRFECKLILTEGDSAAGALCDVRDPKTMGSYPLTGKINNVWDTTPGQLIKMGKVVDLITAIGLVPGKRAMRSELNFGQVIIATDADNDGADIFTLLVNLFFQFWPELFDPKYPPFVYRLVAPNVVASKGSTRIHFATMTLFRQQESKYKSGYDIEYFKGLGSMTTADWVMLLDNPEQCLIPIIDDGDMRDTLELLFGPDPEMRKIWLTTDFTQ